MSLWDLARCKAAATRGASTRPLVRFLRIGDIELDERMRRPHQADAHTGMDGA
jgi:hypothetical protein